MSQEFVAVQLSQTSRNIEKSKPTGIVAKNWYCRSHRVPCDGVVPYPYDFKESSVKC